MSDVIVVGGGVIGLSIAYEFAGQGVAVTLLDQSDFGKEASWAGAGILPPGNPERAQTPEARLRAHSHVLWPQWTQQLREETGIDNGFQRCGGIAVTLESPVSQLDEEIANWCREGVPAKQLSTDDRKTYEPALSQDATAAYRLSELGQVRNPRHLKALVAGCAARGVDLRPGQPVVEIDRVEDQIVAVRTPSEALSAGQFVIAGGAWSQNVLSTAGLTLPVEPVRGQMVLLSMQPLPIRHVIEVGPRYLVPRPDGRILVGSTEEWVGFDKRNTATAVAELLKLAIQLVPKLAQARFEQCWAGLRPRSLDGLPYLGRVPGTDNLYVAAGHFRAGLQMSPITAVVIRQLLLGQETTVPLDAFACDRHHLAELHAKSF